LGAGVVVVVVVEEVLLEVGAGMNAIISRMMTQINRRLTQVHSADE
jgi:hypothetical protein